MPDAQSLGSSNVAKIVIATLIAAMLVLLWPSSALGAPPRGKTYFTSIVGLGLPYETQFGCLTFGATHLCADGGDCGSWEYTQMGEPTRKQSGFRFRFNILNDAGLPIEIDGVGRTDARGRGSSMSGTARAIDPTSGMKINFAMAGRAVGPNRCIDLMTEALASNE